MLVRAFVRASGRIWMYLVYPVVPGQAYLGASGHIVYLGVSGRIWAYLGISGRMYLGGSGRTLAYLSISECILAYLGVTVYIWLS